jgi:hypothetical protein
MARWASIAIMRLPTALSPPDQRQPSMLAGRGFDMHCIKQTDVHYAVLPLYSLGGSGQTTYAENAVTGGEPAAYASSLSN